MMNDEGNVRWTGRMLTGMTKKKLPADECPHCGEYDFHEVRTPVVEKTRKATLWEKITIVVEAGFAPLYSGMKPNEEIVGWKVQDHCEKCGYQTEEREEEADYYDR